MIDDIILYNYVNIRVNTLEFNNLKIESTICRLLYKYSNLDSSKQKKERSGYQRYTKKQMKYDRNKYSTKNLN